MLKFEYLMINIGSNADISIKLAILYKVVIIIDKNLGIN